MRKKILIVFLILLLFVQIASGVGQVVVDSGADFNNKGTLGAPPPARKLVRLSNGTMFMCATEEDDDNSLYIYRSVDNGSTWVLFNTINEPYGIFDPAIVVDSKDTLHVAWSIRPPDALGLQYTNWTKTGGWSGVRYNVTKYAQEGPECINMVVNSSDALYFFFFNSTGTYCQLMNRTFWKGVWSPINELTPLSSNHSDLFEYACVDNNDVIHIVWFEGDQGTIEAIDYCNITNNVRSPITHLTYFSGGSNDDQTNPSIKADSNNNLSVVWSGQDIVNSTYYIKHKYYWFKNQTWSGIRNVGVLRTDGSLYPHADQSIDEDNTVYIVWGGAEAGNEGERFKRYFPSNNTYTPLTMLTTNYKTDHTYTMCANYPKFGGVQTMRPKQGFFIAYWNNSDPGGGSDSICVYNYSAIYPIPTTGAGANNPPVINSVTPSNHSTGVNLQPYCYVDISDPDGDKMNLTYSSNYTGAWIDYNTQNNLANGTYFWQFSGADNYSTRYWWRINVSDGTDDVTATYVFTTMANVTPNPWWDTNWLYVKRIGIGHPLDDYVINITVYASSGHDNPSTRDVSAPGCRSDFGDLRIIAWDNSTELPYWIMPNISYGDHCELYFNNSMNDSYVWLYYGNPTATTTSNGTATFLEYINDATGWSNNNYFTVNGSYLNYYQPTNNLDDYKTRPIHVGRWKNITVEVTSTLYNTVSIGNHNVNYYIKNASSQHAGENLSLFSWYQRNQPPVKHGYRYDANNSGYELKHDETPFGVERTQRMDINTRKQRVNYYIHESKNDTYVAVKTNVGYADGAGNWGLNYLGFWVPYYVDSLGNPYSYGAWINFTGGGIRIRPYSETPSYIISIESASKSGTYGFSMPQATTNITETTATINGVLINDTGVDNIVGFLVYTSTPLDWNNWVYNITMGTLYNMSNPYFSYDLTGLTSGEYYYVKTWTYNGTRYNLSTQTDYFITKPYAASYFRSISNWNGSITFSWIYPVVGDGTTVKGVIYYNQTGIPTSRDKGTEGANVTGTSGGYGTAKVSGLTPGVYYNFSLWIYVNASGSPWRSQWSEDYVWTIGNVSGGLYNISFRYENTTYGLINLTKYPYQHKLIVHYTNRTEVNRLGVSYESNGDFGNLSRGWINLNLTQTPLYFEFRWNDTSSSPYYCTRILLQHPKQFNYTFYVLTDKRVYGETTNVINNSIVKYIYQFVDKSGYFQDKPNLDAYATIYTYDNNGNKMIIHEEFWDVSDQIYPWLLYNKKYFIGLSSSDIMIDRLGIAPTSNDIAPYIYIDPSNITGRLIPYDVYMLDVGWYDGTGMYVYYLDTYFLLVSSHIKIWDHDNGTLMYSDSSTLFVKNYTWTGALHNRTYDWALYLNSTFNSLTVLYSGTLWGIIENITNAGDLNDTLTIIFGITPFRNPDDPSKYVSWVSVLILFIALMFISSLSGYNAALTGIGTGLILVYASVAISGLGAYITVSLVGIGVFLIIMSILYAYGGRK